METRTAAWYVTNQQNWAGVIEEIFTAERPHLADRWLPVDLGTPPRMADIRSLHYFAIETPVGRNKVAIVPWADRMRREVANSLLKLLEEPPAYLTLVLLSESNQVLPTIRSRVSRVAWVPRITEVQGEMDSDYQAWKRLLQSFTPAIPKERQRASELLYLTPLLHETVRHGFVREAFSNTNI